MAIASVVRPWGSRGEVIAEPHTSRAERFQELRRVYLLRQAEDSPSGAAEIEWARRHRGRVILKFRGVEDIGRARALAGTTVCIPQQERPPAPPGEYYHADLLGCEVLERKSGRRLGLVTGWLEAGGPGLLEVTGEEADQELLIPFARSVCVEINVAARRILVDLPEGLEELNRP